MTTLLVIQLACFQFCGWFGVARIVKQGTSAGCSVWREWTLLVGIACQFAIMLQADSPWQVWISPLASACSIATLLFVIYRFR